MAPQRAPVKLFPVIEPFQISLPLAWTRSKFIGPQNPQSICSRHILAALSVVWRSSTKHYCMLAVLLSCKAFKHAIEGKCCGNSVHFMAALEQSKVRRLLSELSTRKAKSLSRYLRSGLSVQEVWPLLQSWRRTADT